MRPVRVAVIGGGFGQHVHVPAFRLDSRSTVDLICVSTESRARALADRMGIGRASGDWREVVADSQIDAIAISVPPAMQAQIAVAAARAGKHVFAEKPLAGNVHEARAMVDAAREAGVVGAVDFEFRELAAWQHARESLARHALGRLRHVYMAWRVESLAHRDPRPSWKRDRIAGGGTLNLFASHSIDAVAWMVGPIVRVAARLIAPTPDAAESRVDAWLTLADGTTVSLAIAADATAATDHRVEVYGDEGALVLENRSGDYATGFSLTYGRRGEPWSAVELPATDAGADGRVVAVGSVVRRFLDAVTARGAATASFADGLAAQRVIDALREAHRTGTWQSLD